MKEKKMRVHNKWYRDDRHGHYFNAAYPDVSIDGAGRRWQVINSEERKSVYLPLWPPYNSLREAKEAVERYYDDLATLKSQPAHPSHQGVFTNASAECIEPRYLGLSPQANDDLWVYKDTMDPVKLLFVSDQWVVVEKITGQQHTVTRADFHASFERSAFKVRVQGYVWCDVCGCIHEHPPSADDRDCSPDDWRIVYTDSFDQDETFG